MPRTSGAACEAARRTPRAGIGFACGVVFGAACMLMARSGAASRATLESHVLETRYGSVSWSYDRSSMIPAKVFVDGDEVATFAWTGAVSIAADETLSDRRVLLLAIEGGSVCVNSYVFLTLSRHGHTRTRVFGSCGEAHVTRDGDEIVVETEAACKPILIDQDEGNDERWRACDAAGYRKYVYRNDRLEVIEGAPDEPED